MYSTTFAVCNLLLSIHLISVNLETGVTLSSSNFSAVHRNGPIKAKGDEDSTILPSSEDGRITRSQSNSRPGNGNGISPGSGDSPMVPSVTVCFYDSNVKDRVLKAYSNYDTTAKKSKPVRLYQSLSPHFKALKSQISSELKEMLKSRNSKSTVRWIHWRPAGLCCKLSDNTLIKGILSIEDFHKKLKVTKL